jgi:centractin
LLRKEGINFRTSSEFEIVRTIKEKECYLSSNPSKEEPGEGERHIFKLPDGNSLDVIPTFQIYLMYVPKHLLFNA